VKSRELAIENTVSNEEEGEMIIKGNSELRNVYGLSNQEIRDIIIFLQGATYCWCKNRKDEWFSLRDLMGGDNYYWNNTPLIALYNKQEKLGNEDPEAQAGKEGGWLMKRVISEDARKFETIEEDLIRKYKWVE
jgi:hypothetical protein